MKKVIIAFDVDGTLIKDGLQDGQVPVANERIRTLLVLLARMKNVEIMVWSGGGELYARQIAREIGVAKYVKHYASKNHTGYDETTKKHQFEPNVKPNIAIDDIEDCELGMINLIVREK